jgi:diguanylate cyclase (GGDEF)-like protein
MQDHSHNGQATIQESSSAAIESDSLISTTVPSPARPCALGQDLAFSEVDGLREQLDLATRELQSLQTTHRVLARTVKELTALTMVDHLTGLRSRRRFREDLESAWAYAIRHNLLLSSIVLDLDLLNAFTVAFGETAGDQVLRTAAGLLARGLRTYDVVARLGGGEFAILLPSTDRSEARQIAERLRKAVKEHEWPLRPITASLGIATLESTTISSRQLVDQSFQALQQAKRQGSNRAVHFFDLQNSSSAIKADIKCRSRLEYLVQM